MGLLAVVPKKIFDKTRVELIWLDKLIQMPTDILSLDKTIEVLDIAVGLRTFGIIPVMSDVSFC